MGAGELVENRRQANRWEREALGELRAGRVGTALAAYHAHDRRHHLDDGLHERLVADWAHARQAGAATMMLATRRADVDRLNDLARHHLRHTGRLGPDLLETAGRVFATGDEIICGRNDRQLGVINGTRATVLDVDVDVDADGTGLTVRSADGSTLVLPGRYLDAGHVNHSYATTIHKAQGATTERTFILADEHLYQEAGYVALSRGRDRNDLYTTTPDLNEDDGHGRRATEERDSLTRALGRSRAQQPAVPIRELPGRSLAELDRERRQLSDIHPDRASRADRDRSGQIDALIKDRTTALGLWAVEHPQPEHLDLLGGPPRNPQRQAEWARAAGEISAYRERHGIAYDANITPEHGCEHFDHYQVTRTIREVTPSLDRSHPVEHHRGRDPGLGL